MPDTRPPDAMSAFSRLAGWSLLALGGVLGIVAPAPVTTTLWTAAARAFARGGDTDMVLRLMSATKFGPRIRRRLSLPAPRRVGGVCEA